MLTFLLAFLPTFAGLSAAGNGSASELTLLDTPAGPGSLAPRLAPVDDRRAVLTWLEREESGHRLRFALHENGAFGPARTVAAGKFFANWADTPGLTVTRDGSWVAHWLQRSGSGTYAYDIRVAISQDEGSNWGEPFTPHRDGTRTEHGFVSYFADPEGAGLAWLDGRNTLPAPADRSTDAHHHPVDGAMTLRTAVIAPDGSLQREALLDDRVCDCCATASAVTGEGPVVVYRDRSEHEIRDLSIVRRTADGWSPPHIIHEDGWRIAACPVNGPAVLARDEVVVVAWFTHGAEDEARVHLAWSRDGGRRFSEPLTLDRGTALGRVDLTWSGSDVLLSWMTRTVGGPQAAGDRGATLRLARFDEQGALLRTRDLVALPGRRGNGFPRLLALADGSVLLSWTEGTASGSRVRVAHLPPER